ncbi:MAG: hypothetical protein PVH91_05695 [Pseudomonadales bacterium]|jgi:hypothetical protein
MTRSNDRSRNQGEGDKASARRFNRDSRAFLDSKEGKAALKKKPTRTESEAKAARQAEEKARSRAKEQDPQVKRDYDKPTR